MNKNENSTTKVDSESGQPEQTQQISDPASEMRRAMEAARERMKRSQAVYSRPAPARERDVGEAD
jgi:hypothetical protein